METSVIGSAATLLERVRAKKGRGRGASSQAEVVPYVPSSRRAKRSDASMASRQVSAIGRSSCSFDGRVRVRLVGGLDCSGAGPSSSNDRRRSFNRFSKPRTPSFVDVEARNVRCTSGLQRASRPLRFDIMHGLARRSGAARWTGCSSSAKRKPGPSIVDRSQSLVIFQAALPPSYPLDYC